GKVLVAAAAAAALRHDDARAGMREIRDEPLLRVEHLRPDGNVQHRVLAVRPVREAPAAGPALAGAQLLIRTNAREVAPPRLGHEHDVTAPAAVAAVRPAARHELLAAEVDRAVTAATGNNGQSSAIVKHRAKGVRP